MEYNQDYRVAGIIPEFGAIFMSNLLTKKECFKRKIFALPSSQAEFVKQVKAGMVLFLFEFKKRQLFGVYQASSDGAIDIVPHAFNYSGRRFPAQVCFTPIWCCDPLSEREFQDAILENYFSAKKFNFGLSEDQVRRLLLLFSSRKMKKEIFPLPRSEIAGKDRRSVGSDRFELSERGYTKPTESDEFNSAVFSDYHTKSSVKEDELLIDDRVNTEEKAYPLVQGNFLAKRRRIDNDDKLLENDVAEIYNYGTLRTFHTDSPRDSLDELRKLAAVRQLLAVERVRNKNQVDKIRNAVLSSESEMEPLDVRTSDDDRFMQRNRLFDEYNMDNGFASDCYEKPLDTSEHALDDDMFLFDDCVQGNQNIRDIFKPMVYDDSNLNVCRQAMQVIEDHRCSINRKLENRYHLDRDVSHFSAIERNASLLHKTRESTSGGRFPVNDRIQNELNFGACSVEDLPSAKFSRPLHCDDRFIHDRKYPIVEGRVTENMVGNTFCSTTSTRNAGYCESLGDRVVDNGRLPSSFNQKPSLPALSNKLLPEKGPFQLNVVHNFGPSRATFDDATITRSTPYTPEHPNLFHGFHASMAANQNSSLVRENPHRGSLYDVYSCKNRSSPYILESGRSLDIAPEFGNKGLPTNTSLGHQSSLRHEATSSFLNSDLSMHADLNASVPVNYRGSLFSQSFLAPPATDHENIEEEGTLFDYPSKSSGNHFAFDENHATASQHTSKHVPCQEIDMLAGKDFISSKAKDSSLGVYLSARDLTCYENQYFGIPSNTNYQVSHEIPEAPHFDSNVNRKSVFSRLREESQGGEERNESGFDRHDRYMDATADEVMEMLRQSNKPSPRKLKKSKVVGQSKHGESAFDEKQVQIHAEVKSSVMENKKVKDAHLAIEESTDEIPRETRNMDFKRRRETKKILVGASSDSITCNNISGAGQGVGNSMKATSKRKKLVRPAFGKAEPATDTCSNQNSSVPDGQIIEDDDKRDCEKAISLCEADMTNNVTRLNDVLVLGTHQSMDDNIKYYSSPEEQNDIGVHVLPSLSSELKDYNPPIVGPHVENQQALTETTPYRSVGDNLTKNVDSTANSLNPEDSTSVGLELAACLNNTGEETSPRKSNLSSELKDNKTSIVGPHKNVDSTASRLNPEESTSLELGAACLNNPVAEKSSRKLNSSSELKDYKTSIVGPRNENPQALTETTTYKSVGNQTSVGDILSKNVDTTVSSLNPEESTSLELGAACLNNPIVETSPRKLNSSSELKDYKTSVVGPRNENPQALTETTTYKSVGNQTSVGDILSKNVDTTVSSLNPEESTSLELGAACLNNPIVETSPRKLNSSSELKDYKTSIVGPRIENPQALLTETNTYMSVGSQTSVGDILSKNVDSTASSLNSEESTSLELGAACLNNLVVETSPRKLNPSSELKDFKTSVVGSHIENPQALLTGTTTYTGVGNQTLVGDILSKNVDSTASSLNPEESTSVGLELAACLKNPVVKRSPRKLNSINEHKDCKTSIVGPHIENPQALTETTTYKSVGNQTSVGDILSKNVDSTTSSLNPEESTSLELGATCLNNPVVEKGPRKLKSKKKIIQKIIKKIIKTKKKIGMEPSQ